MNTFWLFKADHFTETKKQNTQNDLVTLES